VNEQKITEDQVRKEHLAEVNSAAHWAYLAAVLVAAFLLMLGLVAILDAAGG
jgi:hypothetical protein